MTAINIHAAKTHLSQLVEKAAKGEEVVIAKAGKPLVKLVRLDESPAAPPRRIGFLAGSGAIVPAADAFNSMATEEIQALFGLRA